MPNYFWAIIIVGVSLGIFILVYVLNRKTPRPKDCPKDDLPEGCGACMLSCASREAKFDIKNLLSEKDDLRKAGSNATDTSSEDTEAPSETTENKEDLQ